MPSQPDSVSDKGLEDMSGPSAWRASHHFVISRVLVPSVDHLFSCCSPDEQRDIRASELVVLPIVVMCSSFVGSHVLVGLLAHAPADRLFSFHDSAFVD